MPPLVSYGSKYVIIQVVRATQGSVPVDGGIRRGTDVFKALALGASGVFVSVNFRGFIMFSAAPQYIYWIQLGVDLPNTYSF